MFIAYCTTVSQWRTLIWYLYLMDMWINVVSNSSNVLLSGNAAIESNRFVSLV